MTYIATPKLITILGVDFKSYLTEQGEVVFSLRSTAQGFGYKNNGGIMTYLDAMQDKQPKQLKPTPSKRLDAIERDTLKVKDAGKTRQIHVVTKSELTQLVELLAERGNEVAKSMLIAGAATVIQMAVDEAYGVERDRGDYIAQSNAMAKQLRDELRTISGKITNPVLCCNTYVENNLLVYGDGYNRDTYDKKDAHERHEEEKALEMIQAGMKLAGLSMPEVLELSHQVFRQRFRKQAPQDIDGYSGVVVAH